MKKKENDQDTIECQIEQHRRCPFHLTLNVFTHSITE